MVIIVFQHNNIINNKNKHYISRCEKILKNGNQCKCKIFDSDRNLCKRHYNILIKNN